MVVSLGQTVAVAKGIGGEVLQAAAKSTVCTLLADQGLLSFPA
jgi:hypothetical protein